MASLSHLLIYFEQIWTDAVQASYIFLYLRLLPRAACNLRFRPPGGILRSSFLFGDYPTHSAEDQRLSATLCSDSVAQVKWSWVSRWSWVGGNLLASHRSPSTRRWGSGPHRRPLQGCPSTRSPGTDFGTTSPSRWVCRKATLTRWTDLFAPPTQSSACVTVAVPRALWRHLLARSTMGCTCASWITVKHEYHLYRNAYRFSISDKTICKKQKYLNSKS